MADDLNKPIIIDFFGLPGCGKSTVSHMLAEELRKQGKVVSEPSYDTDHKLSQVKRKTNKIISFSTYAVSHPVKTWKLYGTIRKAGNSGASSLPLVMISIVRTKELISVGLDM